ncbi:GNAT family N-acetyltransferase [Legionella nagasakiensis]|uniref:GNAT family N-acetyltransferase n=1 Tax=Legionella nagasakiensis TaxID=535290 RepID=UPI001055C758|nr:GNAT family N-acetyltransferase [Legionella nagasakiensis]
MLIQTNQLNAPQLTKLDGLIAECKMKDHNTLPVYKHILSQQRDKPYNILFYHQQHLVGFMSVFFFYETACEIILMVAPAFRQQGIASTLIAKMIPLLKAYSLDSLLFPVAQGLNLSQHWMLSHGFHYQHSEYEMECMQRQEISEQQNLLQIRLAKESDLAFLCSIDNACFPQQHIDMAARFHMLFSDKNYSIIIACLNNVPIGKAHIHWLENSARLTDIAIIPMQQSRGFGRALIAYCINYALKQGIPTMVLEVEANNQKALELYINLGFTIINAYDYWSIPLDAFSEQFT